MFLVAGEGQTAQAAKHSAAGKALKMLKEMPCYDGKSKLDPTSQPFTPGIEYDELKSPISLGQNIILLTNNTVSYISSMQLCENKDKVVEEDKF